MINNTLKPGETAGKLRKKLYVIIFEADTTAGKLFDVGLIISIILSVVVVMLDSVSEMRVGYGQTLWTLEWFFTIGFSIEYILRLYCVGKSIRYARSFLGIIDLLAVLPTYLSLVLPGTHYLGVIRVLRVLRIFRVLKLVHYMSEASSLMKALRASRRKIEVFLFTVITLVVIMGSLMYVIEGAENGFTSIPRSVYWAIVTLTTVGYGDISPQTGLGQAFAAFIMIFGYSIIAVPTGIVSAEMKSAAMERKSKAVCGRCSETGHDSDAAYCKSCGTKL